MSDEDDEDKAPGAPLWMATFADLMSLLMCFFVLILSFSELDVIKYKQIAESMKDAFGVQQKMKMANQLFDRYGLKHVPVFVVDGTYATDVSMAGGREEVVKIIDYLAREIKREDK